MPVKQVKMFFQSQPLGDTDVVVTVSINGIERFNQAVPKCDPIVLNDPDPCESIEFDVEVPILTQGPLKRVHLPASISCQNGSIKIDYFSNNFALRTSGLTPEQIVPGSATQWYDFCQIVTQPLWNGQALVERYNIEDNLGPSTAHPLTGPGELLIHAGEILTFEIELNKYNDSLPLPPRVDTEWDAPLLSRSSPPPPVN